RGAAAVGCGTIALRQRSGSAIRLGHPWICKEAPGHRRPLGEPGTPVELVDWDGEFVGRGIVDGETAIAIRMMTRSPGQPIDDGLVAMRVKSALAMRRRFFEIGKDEALRIVNAESDGLPAIAVERYGEFLVSQVYSGAAVGLLPALYDTLERELAPPATYEQRRIPSLAGGAPPGAAGPARRAAA